MEEWKDGRVEEYALAFTPNLKVGGMEEGGRLEGWKAGRMHGRVEDWKGGR